MHHARYTPRVSDFLDDKRREIAGRLKELKPLVGEYQRLSVAAAVLDGVGRGGGPTASAAPKRPSAVRKPRAAGRRGRPTGTGKRAEQALDGVKAEPGITIVDLADRLGIKPNYLYRVLPQLAAQGLVEKRGPGWHPTDTSP